MIQTSLSPNSTFKDLLICLSYLIFPWNWKNWQQGKNIEILEEKIKDYLGIDYSYTFNSGRTALYAAIKALGIKEGDEVLIQAFTCVVVPNAVIFNQAKPVYVDIDLETYNFDLEDLKRKITPAAKALIIQNTFGTPADYRKILSIAKEHNLIVIEDCAHSLGGKYQEKKIGTLGDLAVFSFGRDKIISSVAGGAVTTNHLELAQRIKLIRDALPYPKNKTIFQHLMHPLVFALALPVYNFCKLGRSLIYFAQKIGLISKVLTPLEKKCTPEFAQFAKFPNGLAKIALNQFNCLDNFNKHRRELAKFYRRELKDTIYRLPVLTKKESRNVYLRFTIQSKRRDQILECAKKQGIFLGDWYDTVIAPKDVDLNCTFYERGSCSNAEKAAKETLNLPTHHKISLRKAKKIIKLLKKFNIAEA